MNVRGAALYGGRWRKMREAQLARQPLCEMCARQGRFVAAEEVDHVIPHRGDRGVFFTSPLQSLCRPCHHGPKARQDRTGMMPGFGDDGLPLDPNHPWRASAS